MEELIYEVVVEFRKDKTMPWTRTVPVGMFGAEIIMNDFQDVGWESRKITRKITEEIRDVH